ncbi:MAG: hypothetical protein AB7O28_04550 [Vicinamibacterales bacterium]
MAADDAGTAANDSSGGPEAAALGLSGDEKQSLVERKVTCPFLGPAVIAGRLGVRHERDRPLASIEEVRRLGNTGGGDLGDVLVVFAQGNHAKMPGTAGTLDRPVPAGSFSLDLPGSQGSHPGHSGILQGDPSTPGSGRFSQVDLDRLLAHATNGRLTHAGVGAFIKENVERDPDATRFSVRESLKGVVSILAEAVPAGISLLSRAITGRPGQDDDARALLEALTGNARASNLVGSSGEFGLLFAFLEHKPETVRVDGEPTLSVDDVTLMFRDKRLPEGWETWPKTKAGWVTHTLALAHAAAGPG